MLHHPSSSTLPFLPDIPHSKLVSYSTNRPISTRIVHFVYGDKSATDRRVGGTWACSFLTARAVAVPPGKHYRRPTCFAFDLDVSVCEYGISVFDKSLGDLIFGPGQGSRREENYLFEMQDFNRDGILLKGIWTGDNCFKSIFVTILVRVSRYISLVKRASLSLSFAHLSLILKTWAFSSQIVLPMFQLSLSFTLILNLGTTHLGYFVKI